MKIFINLLLLFLFIAGTIGYFIDFIPAELITDNTYYNIGASLAFGCLTFYINKKLYYIALDEPRKYKQVISIIILIGFPSIFFYITTTRTGPMVITSIFGEYGAQEFRIYSKRQGTPGVRYRNRCRYYVNLTTGNSSLSRYKICNIKRSTWNVIELSDTFRIFGKSSFAGIYVEKTQVLKR